MGIVKTNAIRQIEAKKWHFKLYEYQAPEGFLDGKSVAAEIGVAPEKVYKTLVTQGLSREVYVFVIPVGKELDLKKAAQIFKEKKIEMIPSKDITAVTGYVKGGCSPVGMKKTYKTALDETAEGFETIVFSGGRVGLQVELEVKGLKILANALVGSLTVHG